jgi:ribonucleoside-diphosphate reductase alpha chain
MSAQPLDGSYRNGFAAGLSFAISVADAVAERVGAAASTHRAEGAVCALQALADELRREIGATAPVQHAGAAETRQARPPAREEARLKGYEGDPCPDCGAMTMVRNGTCMKCDSCGATTGCS